MAVRFSLSLTSVVRRHAVEADNEMPIVEQALCEMETNEPGGSGNKIAHSSAFATVRPRPWVCRCWYRQTRAL